MPLSLYNTLGRKTEEFVPRTPGRVGFYGCGPTVYNYAHIGNLRSYFTHDILVRTLRERGYNVTHVMNITDVGHLSGDNDEGEDKMVKSAAQAQKSVLEIAQFYTDAFFRDTAALNIKKPDVVCKATEHIDCMIDLIQKIEAAGCTYAAGGNLYFDVSKFPRYGDLALLRLDEVSVSRVDVDKNKRGKHDFALWFTKSKFAGQALVWDSPWGRGYPGWHIECSAMASKYLGAQFDIHAGGIDHIPIHHTNEIAQAESGFGVQPWVRYWLHNEFLVLDKGKMSKSAGGFLTLSSLVEKGFDPLDYRYLLLGAHYRSQLKFSDEALEGARNSRLALLEKLRGVSRNITGNAAPQPTDAASKYFDAFNAALDDDLNTPRALAALWSLVRDSAVPPAAVYASVLTMDRVLGLSLDKAAAAAKDGIDAAEIEALIARRDEAKKSRDFARADEIRAALKSRGVHLEDTKDGTVWRADF